MKGSDAALLVQALFKKDELPGIHKQYPAGQQIDEAEAVHHLHLSPNQRWVDLPPVFSPVIM